MAATTRTERLAIRSPSRGPAPPRSRRWRLLAGRDVGVLRLGVTFEALAYAGFEAYRKSDIGRPSPLEKEKDPRDLE
jgi:hypothetical protein